MTSLITFQENCTLYHLLLDCGLPPAPSPKDDDWWHWLCQGLAFLLAPLFSQRLRSGGSRRDGVGAALPSRAAADICQG